MLDEDDILSEMQKSPVVNLPDKTTGASQLQGSPEITKTKCPTIDPMVRIVRRTILIWSLFQGERRQLKSCMLQRLGFLS
jgi:hypothetical protein